MIIEHYAELAGAAWRWPNFSAQELACPCCGECFLDEGALDALQGVRDRLGAPLAINSAHRCAIHNARVGGAPASEHKRLAFDVSLARHDRQGLYQAMVEAGFQGFGFYRTFLHADMGRRRHWFGKGARKIWAF